MSLLLFNMWCIFVMIVLLLCGLIVMYFFMVVILVSDLKFEVRMGMFSVSDFVIGSLNFLCSEIKMVNWVWVKRFYSFVLVRLCRDCILNVEVCILLVCVLNDDVIWWFLFLMKIKLKVRFFCVRCWLVVRIVFWFLWGLWLFMYRMRGWLVGMLVRLWVVCGILMVRGIVVMDGFLRFWVMRVFVKLWNFFVVDLLIVMILLVCLIIER